LVNSRGGEIKVMVTDPIADMLTRIRNAVMVRHDSVLVPVSKTKLSIAKILKEEGFITDYTVLKGQPQRVIKIMLRYMDNQPAVTGLERVSRPGLRIYVKRHEIPRVYGGLGIAILSTSKGLMIGHKAWQQSLGGELLCYVW
jgi:small subunit ribosomal protein S8